MPSGMIAGMLPLAMLLLLQAQEDKMKAPDLDVQGTWFNVPEPLTLGKLKGKIVLLDFWTYG